MPLTNLLSWILAAMAVSIAAMLTGTVSDLPLLSWIASGLFAATLVATALDVNLPWWDEQAAEDPNAPFAAAIRNARLVMLGYAWGAAALFCLYTLTPLRWRHGLQYGAGMALIAWLILLYVHMLARPGSSLRSPRSLMLATAASLAHGAAALGGLVFLIGSGKIFSIKDDWAANQIFLAGGVTIALLSVISAISQIRLERGRRSAAGSSHAAR